MDFFHTLINFTERAAKLARLIRQEPKLFSLLVEEKGESEKNERFANDFKTLADVLIQELLCYFIKLKFPKLADHVKGEESNVFTNTLGESITVCICQSAKETQDLLAKVLDGNTVAANLLAQLVHKEEEKVELSKEIIDNCPVINLDNVGIWIDPIDSTFQYIQGNPGKLEKGSVFADGLPCVTVLVGVFERDTGFPIGGVINQPFAKQQNGMWESRLYWGIYTLQKCLSSVPLCLHEPPASPLPIVVSNVELKEYQDALSRSCTIVHASGAGYKSLAVVQGTAQAYFCSKGSTFRWDTCAPHGILRSEGGGIISVKSLFILGRKQYLSKDHLLSHQLLYNKPSSSGPKGWCNVDGVVAYKDVQVLITIYDAIKDI